MPGARRKRKGQTGVGKPAQVRKPSVSGSGPDRYDGRSNMKAGEPSPQNPKERADKATFVKTY